MTAVEWTEKDTQRIFPSVLMLVEACGDNDPALWGLRQHVVCKDEISVGPAEEYAWQLIVPLEKIVMHASREFKDVPYEDIIVCYCVCLMTEEKVMHYELQRFLIKTNTVVPVTYASVYRVLN